LPWRSFGAAVSVRRSFGYVFSLRAQYLFGMTHGRDYVPKENLSRNSALNNTEINYHRNPDLQPNMTTPINAEGLWFHNHRTMVHDLSIQGVLTFGNISFHKERTLINFNTYFGIGALMYNTTIDALDANGDLYDLRPAIDLHNQEVLGNASKKDVRSAVKDIYDGSYETEAESNTNHLGDYHLRPSYTLGLGIGFHLSKRITLSVDSRLTFTIDDLLDGDRWLTAEGPPSRETLGLTKDNDNIHFTSIGVHFHLGKDAVEPLYWMNPMDFTYKQLGEMNPEKMIDDLLQDDDKDGVPNRLDQEKETVEGAPVDPKGVALDSDKDGLIDLLDLEPFSPPGYPIDENGIAQVPKEEFDQEMVTQSLNCDQMELPSIHFELNRYAIGPEYYAHLHQIAEKMQMCQDIRVQAIGHTDERSGENYNMQLSWNRVNEAINYLVEKYSLDRGRFLVTFKGESDAEKATNEFGHLLNRRVEFRVAGPSDAGESEPAQPYPDIDAGSNKR